MYDTGLGAIAYQGTLRSKILSKIASRKVPSRTVNILRSKILARFPKKATPSSVAFTPVATVTPAIAPLATVTGTPMALPSLTAAAASGGSAGTGTFFSPAGESAPLEDDAPPVAASKVSPVMLLAIGAAALLLLGKKGR